jgi:excisionase family DNA binding protein
LSDTLFIDEAAKRVGLHPVTLAERARAGKIPGASKPGKRWVFPKAGLDAYLNSKSTCPYTGEEASGGSSYPRTAGELESLLELPTKSRRRNTMRNERVRYGEKQS